jgi:hypothetical protein
MRILFAVMALAAMIGGAALAASALTSQPAAAACGSYDC